ncbi:hypothetical protein FRACYDRAFT_254757 [Fragilariopsis cylindrus CCMP1102]|uniref:Uncharacterized protein n=1 Tax=Fragilariopsis cylindrus CCMP1102 TaxID=635003 RepID=A0A1E7EKE2_9STRA|nr:hypothetical protein FRACYDRAFT_254757 [Fragilariopsis cylindrus CCMP1102]|eukprot:OEU06352.1 hypothetical protein FRACYDRAFT_254757 [Fragilariopsis cylindrus CCMP1102]
MQQYKLQQTIYRRGLIVSYGDDDDEPPKGAQIACSIQLTPEAATLNELVAEVNFTALRAAKAEAEDFAAWAAEARAEALWGTRRELEAAMAARKEYTAAYAARLG